MQAMALDLPDAAPDHLPRWSGFNLLEKFNGKNEPFRENDLGVKETYVDEGVTLKRFRARAQGRAARINKRTSLITVVVANKEGNR